MYLVPALPLSTLSSTAIIIITCSSSSARQLLSLCGSPALCLNPGLLGCSSLWPWSALESPLPAPVWASVCPVRILDLTCELYPRVGTVEEGGFCANTGTRRPWKTLLPEGVVPPAQSCWDSAPCCSASGWRIWSHPCHPSLLPVCHYENKLKLLFFPHIWVFFTILEIQLFLFLSFMGVT